MNSAFVSARVSRDHVLRSAVCLGLMILLTGCSARSIPIASAPTQPLWKDLPAPSLLATQRSALPPTLEANLEGQITLADALRLSVMHSPELSAYAWELRAREARLIQVAQHPNPQLGIRVEDLGPPGFGTGPNQQTDVQSQTTIEFSQIVELGGKRAARMQLAAINRDLASWDFEAARINLLTRVTHDFIDVLAAQEFLSLAEQTQLLAQQVREAVGARVAAGMVSAIEETKADITVASARMEVEQARRGQMAARTRLAANWGAQEAKFEIAGGDLKSLRAIPSFAELRSQIATNPEIARWVVEISQRQAALTLEQVKRVPDVNISGGYRRFHGSNNDALVIGGSIPLPIFDRNRGGIEEAQHHVAKAQEERSTAEKRVFSALVEAYRAWSIAEVERSTIESEILPAAQQTFDALGEGYRAGKFGYLDVLDAQRTLNAVKLQQVKAITAYQQAATDLERLVGTSLSNNLTTSSSSGRE
jgi:outer membrane protein, heavy metal efflux system